ncbi:MAG: YjcZ family sporulation protein [Bacilli bacterium]
MFYQPNYGFNYGCCQTTGFGNNCEYALILVLFILLVIIGCTRFC